MAEYSIAAAAVAETRCPYCGAHPGLPCRVLWMRDGGPVPAGAYRVAQAPHVGRVRPLQRAWSAGYVQALGYAAARVDASTTALEGALDG